MFPWADYLLFLQHTDEKQVAAEIIYRRLCLAHPDRTSIRIWDVGCGSGEVMTNFVKMVGSNTMLDITILEPDLQLFTIVQDKLSQMNVRMVTYISKTLEESNKDEDYIAGFDLIAALKMLYYVDDIVDALQQLYDALAPRGQLCISLHMPQSEAYVIRTMFREYYNVPVASRLDVESLLAVIKRLRWKYELQIVTSYITFSLTDVEELLEKPDDPVMMRHNVVAGITRFIGHSQTIILPSELLVELITLYRKRARSNIVSLAIQDGYVWINKPSC